MAKTSANRITGERPDFGLDLSLFPSLAGLADPAAGGLAIGTIGQGLEGSAASVPLKFGYSNDPATTSPTPPLPSSAPSDDGSAISGLNAFAAINAPLSFSVDARVETDTDHDLWAGTWNGGSQVTGNGAVFVPLPEYQHAPGHDHGGHDHGGHDHHDHGDEDLGTDPGAFAADGGSTPSPESGSPTSGTSVSSYSYSGENHIDSLLGLYKWGGALGTGANLTYSFGTANSVYASGYSEPTNGFAEFSSHQKAQTRLALEFWSDVADLTFTEVTDSASVAGDLRFAKSSEPSTAWAYTPNSGWTGGDVWVGPASNYDDMSLGTYGFQTMLHEIGHGHRQNRWWHRQRFADRRHWQRYVPL